MPRPSPYYDTPPVPADQESPLGTPVDDTMPSGGQMVWSSDVYPPGPHPPNRPTVPPVLPEGHQPPRNIDLPEIQGTLRVGSEISGTAGEWDGNPTIFIYFWLRNGQIIGSGTGSDLPVYTLTPEDEGAMMSVRVRATNDFGDGLADSPQVGPVLPLQPPVNTVPPQATAISGGLQPGGQVGCGPGTWSPTGAYTRQWRSDGTDIPGATATLYVIQESDVGNMLDCAVTATNAGGSTTAVSNALGPITEPP